MDLQIATETFDTADYSWLGSKFGVDTAKSRTLLIADAVEATHYPLGRIKPGTILARYTAGGNAGTWTVYQQDGANGSATPAGIALDGFRVRKNTDGSLKATVTSGAVLLAGTPIQVYLGKLPGLLLADQTTAYVPVAADLPAAFVDIT